MNDLVRINPFPGLRPYAQVEADLFFGRDKQTDELVGRLQSRRFLAVVGTSGSGKSSLVRAGLMPSLEGGFMVSVGAHWRIALFRPQDDPIGFLAHAIVETGALSTQKLAPDAAEAVVETTLRRSSLGLVEAAQLAGLAPHENLLIVVDQFEELFRFADLTKQRGAGDDAPAFVKLLLEATRQKRMPVYVVITMRSDFLGDCARFRDLPEAISDSQYLVPRLTRDELQGVITGPVGVRGGLIAPRLVQRLLNEVGDDTDQLPVLQHALMRAWDHGQQVDGAPTIDQPDLDAIGGLTRALSQHADEAHQSLASDADRAIAERLFKCVTERGADNREIRRPTTLTRIAAIANAEPADVRRVIDAFRAPGRSFLMPPADVPLQDDSVIDISHESLIRQWDRLRDWVEEEAESRSTYLRLVDAARLFAAGKSDLWDELAVTEARRWQQREAPNTAWAERYCPGFDEAMAFLAESKRQVAADRAREEQQAALERAAKERELEQAKALADAQLERADEQRQRARANVRWASALSVSLLVLLALVVWSWLNTQQGLEDTKAALLTAEQEKKNATVALATVEKERHRADEQAQLAKDRLESMKKLLASIPDKTLRARLASQHLLGEVKTLNTTEQRRLATELKSTASGARPGARSSPQYGLKLWAPGATLRVKFIGGTPAQREMARRAAQEWARYGNLRFDFVDDGDAEIRIAFQRNDGSWSYIGSDALGIPAKVPTMNLGIEEAGAMLHEFGHVLGLIHENSSPNANLPWNKDVVYRHFEGAPNYWSRATVDHNLFTQYRDIEYRPFDPDTIMMFSFPGNWFTDGKPRGGKQVLSDSDKQFIARLYPAK